MSAQVDDPIVSAMLAAEPQAEEPASDPIVSAMLDAGQQQNARLGSIMAHASTLDPVRHAKVLGLAKVSGLPEDVVDRNYDQVRTAIEERDFDPAKFRELAPRTADYLDRNPQAAPVLRKDTTALAALEMMTPVGLLNVAPLYNQALLPFLNKSATMASGAIQSVKRSVESGFEMALKKMLVHSPADEALWPEFAGKVREFFDVPSEAQQDLAKVAEQTTPPAPENVGQRLVQGFFGNAAPMIGYYGAAGSLAGPQGMIAGGTLQTFDEKARKYEREYGLDRETANARAVVSSTVESAALAFPMGHYLSGVKGSLQAGTEAALDGPAWKALLTQAKDRLAPAARDLFLMTVAQTAAADLTDELAKRGTSLPSLTPAEFAQHQKDALEQVALDFGPFTLITGGVGLIGDIARARQSVAVEQSLAKRSRIADQLEAAKISPEVAEDALAHLNPDAEKVYVPLELWNRFFQEDDPAAKAAELTGSPDTYAQSVATGADIAIPMETFLTRVDPAARKAWAPDLKTDPEGMTPREREAFAKEAPEKIKVIAAEMAQANEPDAAQRVHDALTAQLVDAGLTESQAKASASLIPEFIRTQAEQFPALGQEGLAEMFPVSVRKGEADAGEAAAQRLNQPVNDALRGMTREQFLGNPKITSNGNARDLVPREVKGLSESPVEPFLDGKYSARFSPSGATVYDGDRVVASYNFGDTLVVDKAYRRQGIGEELVYQWRTRYPAAAVATTRTKASQAIQEKVWDRIQSELGTRLSSTAPDSGATRGYVDILVGKDQRSYRVTLTDKADLSTFVHETGHVFLDMLGTLAQREDAPERVKADYQKALDWFGTEHGNITTEHHEQWARAFEAYLKEGRAPKPELAGVFQRFRNWLVKVYSKIKLVAELPRDIRDVFDRMLATDEEIAAAERKTREPLVTTPEEAGSPEALAAYRERQARVTEEARAKIAELVAKDDKRERSKWWAEERAAVREQVTREVDADPARTAAQVILTGKTADGTEVGDLHLSRAGVEEIKGQTPVYNKYISENGAHPDLVAELLGYGSGEELLTALASIPARGKTIAAAVDRRMAEKYQHLIESGDLPAAAMRAVHNTAELDSLLADLRHLASRINADTKAIDKAGAEAKRRIGTEESAGQRAVRRAVIAPPKEVLGVIRDEAEKAIARRAIGDIRPAQWARAEQTAARDARKAMTSGDLNLAYDKVQAQIYAHEMWRAADAAQRRADKVARRLADAAQSDGIRSYLGKASPAYRDAHDVVMEAVGLKAPAVTAEPRATVSDALAELAASQNPSTFDEASILALERSPRDVKKLTPTELENVRAFSEQIRAAARESNSVLMEGRRVAKESAVEELITSLETNRPVTYTPVNDRRTEGMRRKANRLRGELAADLRRMETLIRAADGYDINGPFHRYIWDVMRRAVGGELDRGRDVAIALDKAMREVPDEIRKRMNERVTIPGLEDATGRPGAVTRQYLLQTFLNMGNKEGRQYLETGNGLTPELQREIVSRMTPEEIDLGQHILDIVGNLWPEIQALQERRTGIKPEGVAALPIETPHGTKPGGYFPIIFDQEGASIPAERQQVGQLADLFDRPNMGLSVAHGFTKERTRNVNKRLLLDNLNVIPQHIRKEIHYLEFIEPVLSVGRLLLDERVRGAMQERLGKEKADLFLQWVRGAANYQLYQTPDQFKGFQKAIEYSRNATTKALLLGKATVLFQNLGNLPLGFRMVGPTYLAKGLLAAVAHPVETARFSFERSSEMRNWQQIVDRDMTEVINQLGSRRDVAAGAERAFAGAIAFSDLLTRVPLWEGAYRKALAEGQNESTAIRRGDEAVRMTMGSAHPVDLPAFFRSRGPARLISMFGGYMNAQYNLVLDAAGEMALRRRQGTFWRHAPELVGGIVAVAITNALLQEYLAGRGPGDDEDKASWALTKMSLFPVQLFPMGGSLARVIESGGKVEFGVTPASAFVAKPVQAGLSVYGAARGDVEPYKATFKTIDALGTMFGVPGAAQAGITGPYVYEWMTGNAPDETPLERAHNLAFRRQKGK